MSEMNIVGIHPSAYIHPSAVVEDGVSIGPGTKIWHQCHIRRGAVIGAHCVLGKGVFIDFAVRIGNGCKIQNNVSVYHGVTLEDEVFVGPLVVFTNDRYPRAFGAWSPEQCVPTLVRRGASLCAGACIRCGVTVGPYAMVGMGAVLTHDPGERELWIGNPARCVGMVDLEGHPLQAPPISIPQ